MNVQRRELCAAGAASLLLSACASSTPGSSGGGVGGGGSGIGSAGAAGTAEARAAAAELSSTGKLRAAINLGNPILASRGANGELRGVSVDLAREAARRLGVSIELVAFNAAGKVVEAIKDQQVDLAFVAIDPLRGADTDYTAPYVIIEGAYLVRNDAPQRRNEDVDRTGVVV